MLNHKWVPLISDTHYLYIHFLSCVLYIQSKDHVEVSAQIRVDILHLDVAAANLIDDVQNDPAAIVDESVSIPSVMLLALEIYALLQTRCQPGTDGLRRVVVTIHDDHCF